MAEPDRGRRAAGRRRVPGAGRGRLTRPARRDRLGRSRCPGAWSTTSTDASTPPPRWRPTSRCSTRSRPVPRRRCGSTAGRRRRSRSVASSPTTTSTARRAPGSASRSCAARPAAGRCSTAATSPTRSRCRARRAPRRRRRGLPDLLAGGLIAGPGRASASTAEVARHDGPAGPVCFAAQQGADLRVGDRKLCGSAQVRRRGAVLQHGSILLDRLPFDETDLLVACPGTPTVTRAPARRHRHAGRSCGVADRPRVVADAVVEGFRTALDLDLRPRPHRGRVARTAHVTRVTVTPSVLRPGYPRRPCDAAGAATRTSRGQLLLLVRQPAAATRTRPRSASPGRERPTSTRSSARPSRSCPGLGLLVVRQGPNAGSRVPARRRRVTALGRHPDSDIFLDDITVSRRHAVVDRDATATCCATSGRSTAPT